MVLVLLINFVFYQRYSQLVCYHCIQICYHIIHTGEKQRTYFITFPDVRIIQKFQGIFRKWFILYDKSYRHILNDASFCETLCRLPETVSYMYPSLKVLTKSLKTVSDENHFIVNLLYHISIKNGRVT